MGYLAVSGGWVLGVSSSVGESSPGSLSSIMITVCVLSWVVSLLSLCLPGGYSPWVILPGIIGRPPHWGRGLVGCFVTRSGLFRWWYVGYCTSYHRWTSFEGGFFGIVFGKGSGISRSGAVGL